MKENINSAYFAGGCFWGVEYYFEHLKGVKSAVSGYMGGVMPYPDYRSVCSGLTGHFEVVKIDYDSSIVDFESLLKLFFEIHDFTQINGQGPDIGSQYLSAVFYNDIKEKNITKKLINILTNKGYNVATSLYKAHDFFDAESFHQNYYQRKGGVPYCHSYKKIF